MFAQPNAPDPQEVADAIVALVDDPPARARHASSSIASVATTLAT